MSLGRFARQGHPEASLVAAAKAAGVNPVQICDYADGAPGLSDVARARIEAAIASGALVGVDRFSNRNAFVY